MQAGSSLPQLVLASQKKKTRMIIRYRRRRRRRRNTLLVLLLYCCCCCCSSSASLFLLQNYCSRANSGPKKRPKQQCQKKPSSWTQYPFFPPTQTRTKKFTNLPYKILLTLQTGYVLQPRKRQTDRQSARAREDEPKSKPEANKGGQRWRHKEEEEEEEGTAEVD